MKHAHVLRGLAANTARLPPDVDETLAADPDVRVVAELAVWAIPEAAAGLAEQLLVGDDGAVAKAAAGNPSLPRAMMRDLMP
ncbi:MAG: hypothetical protein JF621_25845 [Streptomyces turgidiscabies]|nr:hypothetical protein [Streptomyces turgidiscabies]